MQLLIPFLCWLSANNVRIQKTIVPEQSRMVSKYSKSLRESYINYVVLHGYSKSYTCMGIASNSMSDIIL